MYALSIRGKFDIPHWFTEIEMVENRSSSKVRKERATIYEVPKFSDG